MSNPIVQVTVTQTVAPLPDTLQKTGAMLTQGGTILTPGTTAPLQQPSDLTPLLPAAIPVTAVAWSAGAVTATCAHGQPTGARFPVTLAGLVPGAYNGTFWGTATGAGAFTYPLAANPGAMTQAGTAQAGPTAALQSMVNTFFGQGKQRSCYVLELGSPGDVASGVQKLTDFINAQSRQKFYSYLPPRAWNGDANFLALLQQYTSTTSKTYWWVTTTLDKYQQYAGLKDVVALIEAPQYGVWAQNVLTAQAWAAGVMTATSTTNHGVKVGDWFQIAGANPASLDGWHQAVLGTTGTALVYDVADPGVITTPGTLVASNYGSTGVPASEFTQAAPWYVALNAAPGSINRMMPYSYSELLGVTRFPDVGTGALTDALEDASVNIVGFGAEGGITDTILLYGHTMDGRPWNYWYSADWMQINVDLDVSNAVINGSNNPVNPLWYNQPGVDRLESVAAGTAGKGVSYGLAFGKVQMVQLDPQTFIDRLNAGVYAGIVVVNAVPVNIYLTANPGDYRTGFYGGMAMSFTPLRGFEHILFNIDVTDLVAPPS
jgi:hypothetical protein